MANSVGLPPELKQKGVDFENFKNVLDNINTNHFNRLGCWVHLPLIGSIMFFLGVIACFAMGAAGHDAFIIAIVGFLLSIGGVVMAFVAGCKFRSAYILWMGEMNRSYMPKINEEPYWKSKGITFRLTEQFMSGFNNNNSNVRHYFLDIMYGVTVSVQPMVVTSQPQTAAPAYNAPVSLPAWWVQRTDPSTGRVYYANTSTQKTQWTAPTAEQIAAEQKEMNAAAAAPPPAFNSAV